MLLRALAVPFYGSVPDPLEQVQGVDLDGEYFDAHTDTGLTPSTLLPVLWHHDRDPSGMVKGRIGWAGYWRLTSHGWVAEIELDAAPAMVRRLAKATPLYVSTAPRGAPRKEGPRIAKWLVDEVSLTTSPQNVLATAVPLGDSQDLKRSLRRFGSVLDQLQANLRERHAAA